jgi:hypothetical protein
MKWKTLGLTALGFGILMSLNDVICFSMTKEIVNNKGSEKGIFNSKCWLIIPMILYSF